MSEVPARIFTLEEARRALPLVERVVRDLVAAHAAWREALRTFEAGVAAQAGAAATEAATRTVQERAALVEGLLDELRQVGCLVKGIEDGLVDFYALREDRLVFLCWRLGEPTITYWHEVDDGFAGRQPIDTDLFTPLVS